MEPNFWLDFGAWGFGMVSQHRTPATQEEQDITLGQFLKRWGHLSVTVTIGLFLFTQWQASGRERSDMEKDIALLRSEINQLYKANSTQDTEREAAMASLLQRLEVQRADISRVQTQLFEHFQNDDRRFRSSSSPRYGESGTVR